MRVSILLLCFFSGFSTHAQQIEMTHDPACPPVKAMAASMSDANPRLQTDVLARDVGVVEDAQNQIKGHLKDFSDCEIRRITGLAWREFRDEQPKTRLTKQTLVDAVENFGGLIVLSEPAGAAIWVDDTKWTTSTKTKDFTHVGTIRIRLELAGYENVEGTVIVARSKWATFNGKFKRAKPH